VSEIESWAVNVPESPPAPLAEVALAAYRAGVLDARAPATVHYAPTFLLPAPLAEAGAWPVRYPADPPALLAPAVSASARRRYSFAELAFIIGEALVAVGVGDLAFALFTGTVTALFALAPAAGALFVLAGAVGINREESAR